MQREQEEQECARICDVVRRHLLVWYKNYTKAGVDTEWQIIAEELGEETSEVRRKWCMYRDAFVEDMKTLPKLQPGQDITEYLRPEYKTNRFFKFCLFLGDPSRLDVIHADLTDKETQKETKLQKELKCAHIMDVVRKHPFIWYKRYPQRNTFNHARWKEEWEKVAAEVGETVTELKRLWGIYRNMILMDMKRLPKLQPGQDITEYLKPEYRKTCYFKYCLFLGDPSKSGLTQAELNGELEDDIEQCARITDVLRKHPLIWYKSYPERNPVRFHKEWDMIAAELGENKNEIRKKWFSYRGMLVHDMRRLPKLQPGQDITEYLKPEYRKSRYFRHCLFLLDPSKSGLTPAQLNGEAAITYETNCQNAMLQNNKQPNLNNDNGLESTRDIESLNDIDHDEFMDINDDIKRELEQDEEEFLQNSGDSMYEKMEEDQSLLCKYANSNNNDNMTDGDIMDCDSAQISNLDNVKKSSDNRPDSDNDEISLFLRSLLPYFRQLNAIEQMQVRTKFEECILDSLLNKKT